MRRSPALLRAHIARLGLALAFVTGAGLAQAAQFVAVGERPTILYDAPSQRAERQFVVSRQYPLEVLVRLEQWTKVRDMTGDVGWVENKALGMRRFVVVTADSAEVRSAATDAAGVAFTAQRQVLLEVLDAPTPAPAASPAVGAPAVGTPAAAGAPTTAGGSPAALAAGWVRVAHRDGQTGFVRASQVWGV
jgi:SH3-like domain-containing protein